MGLKFQHLQDILAKACKPYMKDLNTMFTDATCYESEMYYHRDSCGERNSLGGAVDCTTRVRNCLGKTFFLHKKNTKRFIKNVWKSFSRNDTFLGLTKSDFESDFDAVAHEFNVFFHDLIDYLSEEMKIVNEEQKTCLIKRYCLSDIYAYEQITVPESHVYYDKGKALINIVWGRIPLDTLSRYYESRYDKNKYHFLSRSLLNSDNAKFYYVKFPSGVKGFFETNF